jgi:hypothetical protein
VNNYPERLCLADGDGLPSHLLTKRSRLLNHLPFEAILKDRNCFDVASLLSDKFGAKKERSLWVRLKTG